MARKLTKPIGPFRTAATTFNRGRERPIEITLYPEYIEVRAIGIKARFHVPYGSILRQGAAAEVKPRIKRGAL